MRFTAYAGTSVVLATGVVIRALHERANFYSACVYLAQSNACLMILTNIALLGVSTVMLGLQRLFYGPLRPIEVEQLYEKAWFAITETCLAMTIFREEVGGWFLVMFVSLLIGKIWAWIGEGRVEILEQQPPTNPRLFHARLSVSLVVSSLFDLLMLQYSANTVLLHARPNMMVMFAFEFAVLAVTSISTAVRYGISAFEANVIRTQMKDRRAQMRRDREEAQSPAPPTDTFTDPEALSSGVAAEEDIDSMDIDVPGWEEKDFFKLVLYLTFFCVLCMFYGMPIHIIRDVALTIRSFYKRITDFVRYRQATRDMNARYPDAAPDEVAREDVCIICREDMRPWSEPAPQTGQQAGNSERNRTAQRSIDERLRPKKLPCGHILHFACLRSWLERQQNCPTCRRPVLAPNTVIRSHTPNHPNPQARALHHLNPPQAQFPGQAGGQRPAPVQNVYQFGPLRIAFGARPGVQAMPQQINHHPIQPNQQIATPGIGNLPQTGNPFGINRHLPGPQTRTIANFSQSSSASQLHQIEQQLMREVQGLRLEADQLHVVRALQGELARLRATQANPDGTSGIPLPTANHYGTSSTGPQPGSLVYGSYPPQQSIDVAHQNLPPGVTVPEGWTVLPLRRLSGSAISNPSGTQSANTHPVTVSHTQSTIVTDQSSPRNISESALATREGSPTASGVSNVCGAPTDLQSESLSAPVLPSGSRPAAQGRLGGSTQGIKSPLGSEIPRWGSASATVETQSGQKSEDAPESKVESSFREYAVDVDDERSSQSIVKGKEDKGKGKATTVEDSAEDVA